MVVEGWTIGRSGLEIAVIRRSLVTQTRERTIQIHDVLVSALCASTDVHVWLSRLAFRYTYVTYSPMFLDVFLVCIPQYLHMEIMTAVR